MRFLCTADQLLRKVAVKLKACRQDVRNLRIAGSRPLISVGKLLWSWTNKFEICYKPTGDFAQNV